MPEYANGGKAPAGVVVVVAAAAVPAAERNDVTFQSGAARASGKTGTLVLDELCRDGGIDTGKESNRELLLSLVALTFLSADCNFLSCDVALSLK